jgi:hypothetical protein
VTSQPATSQLSYRKFHRRFEVSPKQGLSVKTTQGGEI